MSVKNQNRFFKNKTTINIYNKVNVEINFTNKIYELATWWTVQIKISNMKWKRYWLTNDMFIFHKSACIDMYGATNVDDCLEITWKSRDYVI
jgi:hypothetical protein